MHPVSFIRQGEPFRLRPLGRGARGHPDVQTSEIAPPRLVDRRAALVAWDVQTAVADQDYERFARRRVASSYLAPAAVMTCIHDGWVDTNLCLAATNDGWYLRDTLRNHRLPRRLGYELTRAGEILVPPRNVVELDEPAVLVGVPGGGNYYHWLVEAVSRGLLGDSHVPRDTRVVVGPMTAMERSLILSAGIDDSRIIELSANTILRVPTLYVPPRGVSGPGKLLPTSLHALHALRDTASTQMARAPQRIWISRANARRRRIRNEPDVVAMVTTLGFRAIALEDLSFSDQVGLFGSAEIVIGLHGAGLANLAFTAPDTLTIELLPPRLDLARTVLFWTIGAVMRNRYAQLVCAEADDQTHVEWSARDVTVDCEHLRRFLDHLVEPPRTVSTARRGAIS